MLSFIFLTTSTLFALAHCQVRIPLSHATPPSIDALGRRDTDGSSLAVLKNWSPYATYALNISVGTPPQNISVGLSLSTWNTWVPDTSLSLESTYNSSASSTFEDLQDSRGYQTNTYVDGTSSNGPWASDTVGIGNSSVESVFFGVAHYVTGADKGVLALGYPVLNSIVTSEDFLSTLAASGAVSSSAFSLWADDAQGLSGNLLLGAIDSAKYSGTLQRVTMLNYYSVWLDTFNSTVGSDKQELVRSENAFKLSVSPSDTVSVLPETIAFRIWELANATYEPDTGFARIRCDAGSQTDDDDDTKFSIMLGGKYGPTIDLSLADLVLSRDVFPQSSQWSDTDGGGDWCLFAIQNGTRSGLYTLGKSIWTRSYLVFDTFNREMAVAPVLYNVADSDLVVFDQYGANIPNSIAPCTASEWACTNQDIPLSRGRSGGGGLTPLIIIIVPIIICLCAVTGIAGSIWCCKSQGLCCFRRNSDRDAAIARHAAAAGDIYGYPLPGGGGPMGQNGYYASDTAIVSGGPPITEKLASAPVGGGGRGLAPYQYYDPVPSGSRPVSPLSTSTYNAPIGSPPGPLPSVPVPEVPVQQENVPGPAEGIVEPLQSPKGKGRAVDL